MLCILEFIVAELSIDPARATLEHWVRGKEVRHDVSFEHGPNVLRKVRV